MRKFIVTLVKTEHYSADVEIEAANEDEAIALAESEGLEYEPKKIHWRHSEYEVEGIQVREA